ncbi:MAG: YdeI/OmpD-associated family protein [Candidatus Kerfeldbacteria bacterium]|nr:YdeI/OmpD-associated family protein [Candidatus Kerfeldbacteria bacterium]
MSQSLQRSRALPVTVIYRMPSDLGRALDRQPQLKKYWDQMYLASQQSYILFVLGARDLEMRHERVQLILKLMASAFRRTHGIPE